MLNTNQARVKSTWFLDLEIFFIPILPCIQVHRNKQDMQQPTSMWHICHIKNWCHTIHLQPVLPSHFDRQIVFVADLPHFTQVANLPHLSHLGYKPKFGYIAILLDTGLLPFTCGKSAKNRCGRFATHTTQSHR